MRILVFSDTHRRIDGCIRILKSIPKVDLVIHLGDMQNDVDELKMAFPKLPFRSVLGNNDFASIGNYDDLVYADGFKLFLTHGHMFRVKSGTGPLLEQAKKVGANVALFGHTHKSLLKYAGDITLMNPGSASNYAGGGSYGVIEIEGGRLRCAIVEMS